jgi:multiple sugar transport system substrate-binding protein
MRTITSALLGATMLALTVGGASAADLVIWWTEGTSQQENDSFNAVVHEWEQKTGKTADVSYYSSPDITAKVVTAVQAGQPPDLTFGFSFDLANTPTWAYDGLLADLSDVIEPIADNFQKGALQSAYLLNGKTGERAYYAAPWVQMTSQVFYWNDLLEQAGLTEADIPKDWQAFFDFWCDGVQPKLRDAGARIYGIGQGASTGSDDPFLNMQMFLNAFGAEVVSPDGELQINDPDVKQRVIDALASYTKPITSKCTPADSVNWGPADDNVSFLNKKNVLAMNPTLSIPLALKQSNPEDFAKVRTMPWPNGVDGKPTPAFTSVKQILSFSASPNPDNVKSFLQFLLQPDVVGPMLKNYGGRWMPVMPALIDDPFYAQSEDPNIRAMYTQFTQGETRPLPQTYSRLYSKVMQEHLWQKAMGRVVLDGWTPEKAVDELAQRMTELFAG